MNVVKEDMEVVGVTVEEAGDRVIRRQMIYCGDPGREQLKGKGEGEDEEKGGEET